MCVEFEEFEKPPAYLLAFPGRKPDPFLPCPSLCAFAWPATPSLPFIDQNIQQGPQTGLLSSRGLTRVAGCPLLGILPPGFFSLEKAVFSWVLLFVSSDILLLLQFFEAYHLRGVLFSEDTEVRQSLLSHPGAQVLWEGPLWGGRVFLALLSLPCFPACLAGWPFPAFPLRSG